MSPEEKDKVAKLDRMAEIVKTVGFNSRDSSLISELVSLAYNFTGMDMRRSILSGLLKKLERLKRPADIEKCWAKIYEYVSDFTTEIQQYRR